MKAQTKQMLIALLILAAVLAVYMGLRTRSDPEEPVVEDESPLSQKLVDMDDLVHLTFTSHSGEELGFIKNEGVWVSEEETELSMMQEPLDGIERHLRKLEYRRVLKEHDALGEYGLAPAMRKVTATGEDGKSCIVYLGNEVNYSGVYYAMIEGDGAVYTVAGDLVEAIDVDLLELAQVETLPDLSETAIKTLTLMSAEGEIVLKKLTEKTQEIVEQETGERDENGLPVKQEVTTIKEIYHWSLGSGKKIPAGNETLAAVLDELANLTFQSVYAYRPEPEELSSFALETSLTVEYADGTQFVLWLGAPDESQANCFARQGESDLIHLVTASDVDDLLAMTAKTLTAAA